jgi:tetratricopeptide (TPR) repeat protein
MKKFLFALIVCAAGCGFQGIKPDSNAVARSPFNPNAAIEEVQWNEERILRDPKGAIGWSQLSASYLNIARQTDDNFYARKAEEVARKSLSLRTANNANAAVRLAKSILEQHRFEDALAATDQALKIDPSDISALVLRAEILAEVGRYDDAWKLFEKHKLARAGPGALVLKARLLEINGKAEDAEVHLRTAVKVADEDWDMPRESAAWYHLKFGNLLWNEGKIAEANNQYEIAIELNPRDFKSLCGLARVAAANGNLDDAKVWGARSLAIAPVVEVASLLEDIALSEDDKENATKYATTVDKISHPEFYGFLTDPNNQQAEKAHTHDRLFALYCADHKENLSDALIATKKDLELRQDIYAYDTLAWVLHRMGRDKEALTFMNKALARGTRDAKMLYHSGMIRAALGDDMGATKHLQAALAINPNFQFGHADRARKVLAKMGGRSK